MKNFNLLVSAPRYNENNAKAELWFALLIVGDSYPIISNLEFMGLITAFTNLNGKEVIKKIKNILQKEPNFFKYVLKIIPLDFVCETNVKIISQLIKANYKRFIKQNESFKIELKRRKNELIDRNSFVEKIAKIIDNKVDLDSPDKIIRFEFLSNICGISFIRLEDKLSIRKQVSDFNPI